jgi:antitoxin VapB
VRLFRNGANQAVRIPREFEFEAQEVVMTKVGNTLVLEALSPKPKKGTAAALLAALNSMKDWPAVTEPFPNADEGMLPLDEIDLEK